MRGCAGWAVDWKALQPQGYVSDFADVIDAASKARLEAYCAAVEQSTGAQMALVTVPSLEGEPIEDVANTIFRAWGVGQKGKNEGILLLLAIDDRRSRLEVGYGLEPILPDGLDGSILREMRPALRQQRLRRRPDGRRADHRQRHRRRPSTSPFKRTLPRRVAAASVRFDSLAHDHRRRCSLIWLMRAGGPRGYGGGGGGGFLPGLILGTMMNRGSWGSRGSGGFGGSDSGDGFGGFGGGDSGGGGASSDW